MSSGRAPENEEREKRKDRKMSEMKRGQKRNKNYNVVTTKTIGSKAT
jgi:hypothetical protein